MPTFNGAKQYYTSQQHCTTSCWRCGWRFVCGSRNSSGNNLCFLPQTVNEIRRRIRFVGLFILASYLCKLIFILKWNFLSHFLLEKHVDIVIWSLVQLKIKILKKVTIVTTALYSTTLTRPSKENRFQVACDIVNHIIVMKYYIFDV